MQDNVQIITPHHTRSYNVVEDVQTAIGKSSFSVMYPEDVEHIKTSNDIIQSVVTPFKESHLEKEDSSVDELISQ